MGYEANTGLGVNNHYGARNTGNGIGTIKTEGAYNELAVFVTGEMLNNSFRPEVILPKGALVMEAFIDVSEAFSFGGTSPTIEVGTSGSEATNGVTTTKTQAEAIGTKDITSAIAGTWGSGLTAATAVGVAMGGTSPTATSAGKARVVVRYINV